MATQRNYTGYSGQMAVMAELLFRQCNAAVPVIDVGTDVFAFRDDREEVARIQVKAAQGERYKKGGGYHAQFNISMSQLRATDEPPLYYALAVRLAFQWVSFLVIGRRRLKEYWESGSFGIENPKSGELALSIKYRPAADASDKLTVRCGNVELNEYLDAWEQLPPLRPLPA
jgi:hypothetical protein